MTPKKLRGSVLSLYGIVRVARLHQREIAQPSGICAFVRKIWDNRSHDPEEAPGFCFQSIRESNSCALALKKIRAALGLARNCMTF